MRSVKDTVLVLPRRRLRQSGAALSPHHLCTLPGSSVLETEAQRYGSQSQSERCSQRWGGTPKRREPEKAAPATLPRPATAPPPTPGGSQSAGPAGRKRSSSASLCAVLAFSHPRSGHTRDPFVLLFSLPPRAGWACIQSAEAGPGRE